MYQYGYNLAEVSCPFPMMTKWSRDLPILYANNVNLWTPETMPNFESTLPGMYLGVRMSWYTKAAPKSILDEFFTRFYGSVEAPMREYWETIDEAWANVPEHAGCRFGHAVRFTPAVMKAAREALDQALAGSQTVMEYRRVKFANDSFREFELYMKIHNDLVSGRWRNLEKDTARWRGTWDSLRDEYKEQYAFSPYGNTYFGYYTAALVKDATRISQKCKILTRPIRKWGYQVDKDKKGQGLGWSKPDFDDKEWKTTDPCVETWSALGLFDYFGTVWYRTKVKLPKLTEGKRAFVWLGGTDGSTRLFVNGMHIPYVNAKGETVEQHGGFSPCILATHGLRKCLMIRLALCHRTCFLYMSHRERFQRIGIP